MNAWEEFWRQIALLGSAALAIVLAIVGDLTRILHEEEQGGPRLSWKRAPSILLRGCLMGVIATTTSLYLHTAYGVPELAGAALGGILGYLGPSVIGTGVKAALARYLPKQPKGPTDA